MYINIVEGVEDICVHQMSEREVSVNYPRGSFKQYSFDGIFDYKSEKKDMWRRCCLPLVNYAMAGLTSTCLIYTTPTQNSKWIDLMGISERASTSNSVSESPLHSKGGLVPMTLSYIFQIQEEYKRTKERGGLHVHMQLFLLRGDNSSIIDLFNPQNDNLLIREENVSSAVYTIYIGRSIYFRCHRGSN